MRIPRAAPPLPAASTISRTRRRSTSKWVPSSACTRSSHGVCGAGRPPRAAPPVARPAWASSDSRSTRPAAGFSKSTEVAPMLDHRPGAGHAVAAAVGALRSAALVAHRRDGLVAEAGRDQDQRQRRQRHAHARRRRQARSGAGRARSSEQNMSRSTSARPSAASVPRRGASDRRAARPPARPPGPRARGRRRPAPRPRSRVPRYGRRAPHTPRRTPSPRSTSAGRGWPTIAANASSMSGHTPSRVPAARSPRSATCGSDRFRSLPAVHRPTWSIARLATIPRRAEGRIIRRGMPAPVPKFVGRYEVLERLAVGGHGRAVQGPGPRRARLREAHRDQEDPPPPRRRPVLRRYVHRRGPAHRPPRPPAHRPGLRARHRRRHPVHRDAVRPGPRRPGPAPGVLAHPDPAAARAGRGHRARRPRRPRLRPRRHRRRRPPARASSTATSRPATSWCRATATSS